MRERRVDRTLVEPAMHGDEDAYTSLMATAGDRLLAIAYRILRDLHRAEDAVQAALLGAWRDLPTLHVPPGGGRPRCVSRAVTG